MGYAESVAFGAESAFRFSGQSLVGSVIAIVQITSTPPSEPSSPPARTACPGAAGRDDTDADCSPEQPLGIIRIPALEAVGCPPAGRPGASARFFLIQPAIGSAHSTDLFPRRALGKTQFLNLFQQI